MLIKQLYLPTLKINYLKKKKFKVKKKIKENYIFKKKR